MTAVAPAVDAAPAVDGRTGRRDPVVIASVIWLVVLAALAIGGEAWPFVHDPQAIDPGSVSYTHLRAHET